MPVKLMPENVPILLISASKRTGQPVLGDPVLNNFTAMLYDEEGQGLVEYALIIALVSIVAIAALRLLGNKANNALSNASNSLGD
jgi:pilus assembly protein Flp/PilA